MSKVTLILFCVLLFKVCATLPVAITGPDYYWREYTGAIPNDAFPVGEDLKEKPMYIGQVLNKHALIPGGVFTDGEIKIIIYHENMMKMEMNKNFKILCTKYPEQFQWLHVNNTDVSELYKEDRLIVGGFESKNVTYIGRKVLETGTIVGKFQSTDNTFKEIHFANVFDDFEVLAYNPEIPIDSDENLKVRTLNKIHYYSDVINMYNFK